MWRPALMTLSLWMLRKFLIANRGEIAVRIARTARELGIRTVVVYSEDDAASAHVRAGDLAHQLDGLGAAAYLDAGQIVRVALEHGCDAIHPGYGFLSENAAFARLVSTSGLQFVGPSAELIELFGSKTRARELAKACGIPIIAGTVGPTSLEEAEAFLASLGPNGALMIKAVAGGGGRGMRMVEDAPGLAQAYARCRSEAKRSFGDDRVYVERFISRARHVEVQIVGDGVQVSHLWERECSLQRQNQKLIEIAPASNIDEGLRQRLLDAATRMATASQYRNLGTFEFLIDLDRPGEADEVCFIECNPRIQVEHTVTEEVLGLDLVRVQLEIASGRSLAELGLAQKDIPAPRGFALQLRINMEVMDGEGRSRPSSGTIGTFPPPGGPGVRVDTFGYPGYRTVASFDSLLAKLIVSSPRPDFASVLSRARRAAAEFVIDGVATNLTFLRALLDHPDVAAGLINTRFIEQHIGELLASLPEPAATSAPAAVSPGEARPTPAPLVTQAGVSRIDASLTGILSSFLVRVGDSVAKGDPVAVVEAMKMEHVLVAAGGGVVCELRVAAGEQIEAGMALLLIEDRDETEGVGAVVAEIDLDHIRDDLQAMLDASAATLDAARPQAVAKRRSRGQRTARENIDDLCDAGSFAEYGQLVVANRHSQGTLDQLRATSPADGMIMGLATVNADLFGKDATSIAVASYDFTVFAGTQGKRNHDKTDRILEVAHELRLPFVLFAEGGGGRPGDDPGGTIAGLNTPTFAHLARLLGKVPVVGIVSGRCFAGNAALLGCADGIIATENSNMGRGRPALIEA